MHKIQLKSMHALVVRCPGCSSHHTVSTNRGKVSTSVAFNHAAQKFTNKCGSCGKDVDWTPDDTKQVAIEASAASV